MPPRRSLCPRRLRRRLGPMCRRGCGGSPGCRQQPEHCSSPPSRTRCPRQLQRLPGSGRVTTEALEKRLDGFCSVVSSRGLQQGVMCLTCPQPICSRGETGALHVLRGVCRSAAPSLKGPVGPFRSPPRLGARVPPRQLVPGLSLVGWVVAAVVPPNG